MFHLRQPTEIELRLMGYRLVTAEITYRLPDYQSILNELVIQKLDIAPKFPVLKEYFDFWEREIEGPLHSVRITHSLPLELSDLRAYKHEIRLH